MKRREVIKGIGLAAGGMVLPASAQAGAPGDVRAERSLRVAHITDIHIRPEENAPDRFEKCIEKVKSHNVDFFLNGGDTVFAVDYKDITRARTNELWGIWREVASKLATQDVYSCLGNHDMWWAAPGESDRMYGKPYALEQVQMPDRYYSFDRSGWHFIVLDSNNKNAGSLDEEQRTWLERDLEQLHTGANVLVMSHYPILAASTILVGGNHTDSQYITKLFYRHRDKKISCISGHVHLYDATVYNGVNYYCNGAVSGFWWGEGDQDSAGKYFYHETAPGYAILDLFEDGKVENSYYPHGF